MSEIAIVIDDNYNCHVDDRLPITDESKRSHHVMVNGERVASRAVGPGFDDAQIHWMHADPRGTVELETDSKGEVLSQIAYFPTGEFWHGGASGARGPPTFRFQGKELEGSTGLYAFGKRHYEPRLGLWLSPDPAFPEYFTTGLSGGMHNPRNLGLYSYVWNNPLRFVDPDGRAVNILGGGPSPGRW